ncbi:MAG: FG-GAP repeat protein [Acidobacteria bacterium]|nr:FG-GAP repeat protein [Acidobacteriota bacterium]
MLLAAAISLWAVGAAVAQTVSLVQRFSGASQSRFGQSVALGDEFLMVGVVGNQFITPFLGAQGYVQVCRRTASGTWAAFQQLRASDGRPRDNFGSDVALSGNTLVVGAAIGGGPIGGEHGAAYVFGWDGSTWVQQAKLTASDANTVDLFGQEVDIDGDTIVVGAIGGNRILDPIGNPVANGSVYVFERAGTAWVEQRLQEPAERHSFGMSVAISGNTICVGMVESHTSASYAQGKAYVYRRAGAWSMQGELQAPDLGPRDRYGVACDVEGDTIAVGAREAAAPAAPPGTYYVRIVALNAAGTSPVSNEVAVVVP